MDINATRANFLAELDQEIATHNWKRTFDAGLYQFLVIGAAIAGFCSAAAGLLERPYIAGAIGLLTGVATLLSQQLHCVKAIDWHFRMLTALEGIKSQLLYEGETVERLSQVRRELKARMADLWEKTSNAPPPDLGEVRKQNRKKAS